MRFLEEIFLESDFDSHQSARKERDQRLAQLQAQGYECRAENLYTVHTGMQVLIVVAVPPAEVSDSLRSKEPAGSISGEPAQGERPRPKIQPKSRSPKPEKLKYSDRSHPRTDPHHA